MLGQISFPVNSSVSKKDIVVGGADDRKRMTDLDSDFRNIIYPGQDNATAIVYTKKKIKNN